MSQEDEKKNPSFHKEWTKENSLTDPLDRNTERKWRPDQGARPLTNEEVDKAMNDLNVDAFLRVERRYIDPPVNLQKIGLFSFVPAKGATPNEKGVYGWAKLRGNFDTAVEANEHAERIVRNVDSYHAIYHTYVGRPFPVTVSSDFSEEVNRVDLQREMTKDISSDVKSKREKEMRDIEEIKKREAELLERNKKVLADPENKEPADPTLELDEYITLRVKKAQLTWTLLETKKKMEEIVGILARTRVDLEEMEAKNPEHKETYFQKYMKAREDVGLDNAKHQDNFIRYMVEDVVIPEVEEEYKKQKDKEDKEHKG